MASNRWFHELSAIRWIFAIFGILIMVFSGGCAMVFYTAFWNGGFADSFVIMMFAGPAFLTGLLLWWLAAMVGRQKDPGDDQ